MENGFMKVLVGCLPSFLIFTVGFGVEKDSANQNSLAKNNSVEKSEKSLQDPIEYVLEKLQHYDLVMIGERHWTHEEPVFIQNLIKHCYDKNAIDVVFLEFGSFENQWRIDSFFKSNKYDPKPVMDTLRNETEFGWGYQEYFDILKLIYDENSKKPPTERIKVVLVDGSLEGVNLYSYLYEQIKRSKVPPEKIFTVTGSLKDAIFDRDRFMSDVIEMYRYEMNVVKAIYYAGSQHIRKDLKMKGYGQRYYAAGGLLAGRYPDRVCCLAFHQRPQYWKDPNDFEFFEQLYKNHNEPFAIDTNNPKIRHLTLKSDVTQEGVALHQAFDGYIMLNLEKDYSQCDFIPGFYDDKFAGEIWERLRKDKESFEKFPPELEKFKTRPWSGEELRELMKQGFH